jgi:hypothetical protein
MSYQGVPPKYAAIQLGSGAGAGDAFAAAIGLPGPYSQTYTTNEDGSVTVYNDAFGSVSFAVGDWQVSNPYWVTFPGWNGAIPSGHYTNEQFTTQYTSSS